jgi:hypothetical protein
MIKIKDIIKEHKIIMTEAFASGKLRALTNNWRSNDSDFWSYGAKLGIEWDKITDQEIKTNTKPLKKGIELVYVDKEVKVPQKGNTGNWGKYDIGLEKFTLISVLRDGKPLWYTKSWKPLTNVMTATGKTTKTSRYGRTTSKVPDIDAGTRNWSRDKQFGLNMIGYQSLAGMMSIPGVKFHHIDLSEDQPYMGAGIKRQMRQAAQFGAAKFTTNDEFARINKQYFDELLKAKLNDPKKLAAKVKQAANFCQQIMDSALGGVKATGKVKSIIDKYQSNRTVATQESDAYALASEVGDELSRLYRYYGYYLEAIQKEKEDKINYGTADFARSDVEGHAKDVQQYYNYIMSGKF